MALKRIMWLVGSLATAFWILCGDAWAQSNYPDKTITVIVPMTPGGPPDVISRTVIPEMTGPLGASIIVENKPGAAGAIGAAYVAKSAPDGYTVLAVTNNALSVLPATRKDLGYSLQDFAAIGGFVSDPGIIVVRAGRGWDSLDALVKYARSNPKKLSYGSAGVGTTTNLAMEAIKQAHGLDIVHVPFKGTQPAKSALIGGHVDIAVGPVSVMMPQIKSGELIPIATTSHSRIRGLPDVPTVAEKGVPQASFNLWVGLFVPAKTPALIVDRLRSTLAAVLKDPKVAGRVENLGMVIDFTNPEQTMTRLRTEYDTVVQLAKTLPIGKQ